MSGKFKLMIVDDSTIIRKVIEKNLAIFNVELVAMAADGKEALEKFKETSPQIVTLDITMPEMDGLTVLEEMINIDPKVKVMVVTALSDKATGLKAIKLGAKSFVGKPFTEEKLKESFQNLLNQLKSGE
ncbi:MAG: response regulator [Calditrichaceae bacterium]|nr:response regulator [Calditrichaceae bacterium]MBN2707606.1 response regulator [Calditrichaceae bacterium]